MYSTHCSIKNSEARHFARYKLLSGVLTAFFISSETSEDSVIPTMTPMMMPSGVIISWSALEHWETNVFAFRNEYLQMWKIKGIFMGAPPTVKLAV